MQSDSTTDTLGNVEYSSITTTTSSNSTESVKSNRVKTTGDTTTTAPKTDTSKKFDNPPITTGNIILANIVNPKNAKVKDRLKYSIIILEFNFLDSTSL